MASIAMTMGSGTVAVSLRDSNASCGATRPPMTVASRSEFQSIHREADSRSMSTAKPIAHTSGNALIQFQLRTVGAGTAVGVTDAGCEFDGAGTG